jgi:NADH:ubiquinone oxidoreductase subunit
MRFILSLITWWNRETLGTRLFTWRKGTKVGEDAEGNAYYQSKDGKRRWVIYNGDIDATRVSADWHGWLHFTWNETPDQSPLVHKAWEKPHQVNPTGTSAAYAPAGSLRQAAPTARDDYEAWQPE